MTMPETSMNEDDRTTLWKNDIWPSWQVGSVQTEAKT
jgi:hypothetical protein